MVRALNFVLHHAVQLILGSTRVAGVAGRALGILLVGQNQFIGCVGGDFHAAVFQHLTQLTHCVAIGVARADIEFGDRQLVGAGTAQLKAAGAQQNRKPHHQQIAFDHVLLPLKPDGPTTRP